jgi:hypothetical protein
LLSLWKNFSHVTPSPNLPTAPSQLRKQDHVDLNRNSTEAEAAMNNQQLYLSIDIPCIAIALSWLSTFLQNNKLDGRMESYANRMEAKLENLRTEMATELRAIRSDINTITQPREQEPR